MACNSHRVCHPPPPSVAILFIYHNKNTIRKSGLVDLTPMEYSQSLTLKRRYACPLSWWNSSAHRFKNLERLAVKYLAIPATSAPSERIWSRAARVLTVKRNRMSEEVTSAMMYCRENRELLHKYYAEIARERMHRDDHHLIEKQKALLPTFENEEDAESKIDVGVDEVVKRKVAFLGYNMFLLSQTIT